MIRFLLASKVGCVTGRALAKAISLKQGRRCFCHCKSEVPQFRWHKTHINWGTTEPFPGLHVNRTDSVAIASNKSQALTNMRLAGVSVPEINPDDSKRRIYRKNFRHAGNDNPFIIAPGETAPPGYSYCLEFIKKAKEFRVHVFGGEVLKVQKKCKKRGVEHDQHIRSENRGWVLCDWDGGREEEELQEEVQAIGLKAAHALGLHFGAVDVIQAREDGKLYVLEVNTAPGLSEAGVEMYANAFVQWDNS